MENFGTACEAAGGRFVDEPLSDELYPSLPGVHADQLYCQVARVEDGYPVTGFRTDYIFMCAAPSCTPESDYIELADGEEHLHPDLVLAATELFVEFDDEVEHCTVDNRPPKSVREQIEACREKFQPNRAMICEANENFCAFEIAFYNDISQTGSTCRAYCKSHGGTCLYAGGYDDDCSFRRDHRGSCDLIFADDICTMDELPMDQVTVPPVNPTAAPTRGPW